MELKIFLSEKFLGQHKISKFYTCRLSCIGKRRRYTAALSYPDVYKRQDLICMVAYLGISLCLINDLLNLICAFVFIAIRALTSVFYSLKNNFRFISSFSRSSSCRSSDSSKSAFCRSSAPSLYGRRSYFCRFCVLCNSRTSI